MSVFFCSATIHYNPLMFRRDAVAFLVTFFLIALLARQRGVAALLGLVVLALFVSERWSRWALRRVQYERTLDQAYAFVGDDVALTVRVANPKLVGVPRLRCTDNVPAKLLYNRPTHPSGQPATVLLERTTVLRPYEAVSWTIKVTCTQRGLYNFGPVELTASDPFGLYERSTALAGTVRLIVYPELAALPNLALHSRQPLGDQRSRRQLFYDPARTVGVRDYEPTDPFKTIHWTATARRGVLQTRVFEPTTTLEMAILLDLDTFEQYWQGVRPDIVEHLISAAATVATQAEAGQWSFGLYANAGTADSSELVRLAPSRNPAQLGLILEALAKVVPYSVVTLPQLLRHTGRSLPWGATVVVISAIATPLHRAALLRLAERGRRVLWLYGGEDALPTVPGVVVQRLD